MPLLVITLVSADEGLSVVLELVLWGYLEFPPRGSGLRSASAFLGPRFLHKLAAGPKHELLRLAQFDVACAGPPLQIGILALSDGIVAGARANWRSRYVVRVVVMEVLQLPAVLKQLLPAHSIKSIAA